MNVKPSSSRPIQQNNNIAQTPSANSPSSSSSPTASNSKVLKYFNYAKDITPPFTQYLNLNKINLQSDCEEYNAIVEKIKGNPIVLLINRTTGAIYRNKNEDPTSNTQFVNMVFYTTDLKKLNELLKQIRATNPQCLECIVSNQNFITTIDNLDDLKDYLKQRLGQTNHPLYFIKDSVTFLEQDVGDSDSDDFDDYQANQNGSELQMRWFTVDRPIKAEHTTIIANDGRLKGNTLIKICHNLIQSACNKQYADKGFVKSDNMPNFFTEDTIPSYKYTEASDWVFNLGILSRFKSTSEIQLNVHLNTPLTNFTVGKNGIKLNMIDRDFTERMLLDQEFLDDWNKAFPNNTLKTNDLTYQDILNCYKIILDFLKTIDPKFSDRSMADIQLQLLKFKEEVECSETIRVANFESQWIATTQYLDFMNALMFGLEASRINVTLITGVMTLELIMAGHITYKDAVFQNKYGGQFPLSTAYSGSDNFKARRVFLETNDSIGMRQDRQHPQWLGITCKESIIIKNWFNMKLGESTKTFSVEQLKQNFEIYIKGIIKGYYNTQL